MLGILYSESLLFDKSVSCADIPGMCGHFVEWVDILWNVLTFCGMCGHSEECVDILWNVWTFCRMCGHSVECVDILWNVWTFCGMCGHSAECVECVDILWNVWTFYEMCGHSVEWVDILMYLLCWEQTKRENSENWWEQITRKQSDRAGIWLVWRAGMGQKKD